MATLLIQTTRQMSRGYLISFEGLDGSGKTTQVDLLSQWLTSRNISHIVTREPGGTPLGKEIRHMLLGRDDLATTPIAELLLFQTDRAQHFEKVVLPALEDGIHVITDRCFDSNMAYQGAQGLNTSLIEQLSRLAMKDKSPDLTILLNLGVSQVRERTRKGDRFDRAGELFYSRVRWHYLELARKLPGRVQVVDAAQSLDIVHQQVVKHVEALLSVESED